MSDLFASLLHHFCITHVKKWLFSQGKQTDALDFDKAAVTDLGILHHFCITFASLLHHSWRFPRETGQKACITFASLLHQSYYFQVRLTSDAAPIPLRGVLKGAASVSVVPPLFSWSFVFVE